MAASTNDNPAGLAARIASRTQAYSAKEPYPLPLRSAHTSSPGLNRVTSGPTDSTVPARSQPITVVRGRISPNATRAIGGFPVR